MPQTTKILILGATGHFGGRICRRIAGEPNVKLFVSSRSEPDAIRLANDLQENFPNTEVTGVRLDQTSATFELDVEELRPDIVLHTAGPYQGQDYRVANTCIDCGSHYIDLADGREFVENFGSLHEAARRRNVLLVSGASTLPGLSSTVIDSFRDRFSAIHEIEISIAPAHQTPRGAGTISAVLSYCGKPFQVLENGVWVTRFGWQDLHFQRYPALKTRLSGACDVPDLSLLPKYVVGCRTVTFHAALEAPWEQLALWSMAWLTRWRLVRDWQRLVPTFRWIGDRLNSLGSDTGGMHIRLSGVDSDRADMTLNWYLTARKNHGPEIPCTPALIIARKLVRNEISERGAYPCLGLFSLSEFDEEVSDLDIHWEIVD